MTGQPPPVAYIEAGKLHPDIENRPRKSGADELHALAATIRHLGIIVPLLVVPHPNRPRHYLIRDGHRRYAAGQIAGLSEYPCMLRRETAAERAAGSALTRIVLDRTKVAHNPAEIALALEAILAEGRMTQAQLAEITGMSQATISYHLELLDLAPDTLAKVAAGDLPAGAAHRIVKNVRAAAAGPGEPGKPGKRRGPAAGSKRKPGKPPAHFDGTHPLAADAAARCAQARHEPWTRLDQIACGSCFEAEITARALASGGHPATPMSPADRTAALFRLGVRIEDLRPEVAARWRLPGEQPPALTVPFQPAAEAS